MNSMILSLIAGFFGKLTSLFKESGLYKIITGIHNWFSKAWDTSITISALKKEPKKNIFYKIMYFPIGIFEFLNKKTGGWILKRIKTSFILGIARTFMNNMLALNTKFLGCMILGVMLVKVITSFSIPVVCIGLFGAVLLVLDYNIIDFFDTSKFVAFDLKAAGFNIKIADCYKKDGIGTRRALIIALLFGLIAGVLPPILGALMIVGTAGIITVISYPIVGVFGAVVAAPFVPTMVLAGICLLTTMSFLVKAITTPDFKWRKDGIGIGFFLTILFVSSLFSFSPVKSLMVWAMYLVFAGFFFVIINTVRTKEQVYALIRVFVLAGAVVAIYGILQYIFGWNTSNAWIDEEMFEEATMRAYSTMENPNVLGEYLLLLIPLAAIFIFKKGSSVLERITYGGIFIIGSLCMIFTQSRGCWLGLILAAAIFVTFYNGKLWALIPILLLAVPFIMPETMVERMMSVGDLEDSSTSYRVFIWKGTFRMLRDLWIGGIGMGEGAFRTVYPVYSYIGIIAPHAHNTFLQLVVEGGIGTLAIFLGMMVTFLRKVAAVFKEATKNSIDAVSALAIGSSVCGFLLQSMFDYTFYNYRMMAMFFMILALGVTLKVCKGEEK
ncbi:MAG: O-antigen ligase family protein [Clostridia bacterium]|nr:O-antigen ligase family protein [Clostridia bacterium]